MRSNMRCISGKPDHIDISVERKANRLDKSIAVLLPTSAAARRSAGSTPAQCGSTARCEDANDSVSPGDVIDIEEPDAVAATPQPEALADGRDVRRCRSCGGQQGGRHGWCIPAQATPLARWSTPCWRMRLRSPKWAMKRGRASSIALTKRPAACSWWPKPMRLIALCKSSSNAREIRKTYLAVCIGEVQPLRGAIDKPIARDPSNRQRMAVLVRRARGGDRVCGD